MCEYENVCVCVCVCVCVRLSECAPRTGEEDDVSVSCVIGLHLDEAVQVGGRPRGSITVMIMEELHQVFLLVRRQQV